MPPLPLDHHLVDRPLVDPRLVDRPLAHCLLVHRPLADRPLVDRHLQKHLKHPSLHTTTWQALIASLNGQTTALLLTMESVSK